ncbi:MULTISPECIES: restriction endonuclease subunit S [Pelosinus]|uniref:Restriction modification system DNA specificity domain-containing protein n=1 Tax=Pelosinus fermentans B4 TaxID=1149862 RepID=I9LAD7_9FIRM|nr:MULTISPECIES: restriction endonuclease subunit S [Pelosinus]EIW17359.1 restriction modification system DNA specificity domain-containing protein [Pelosinus fermentans B4]EIW23418.1 restriction modification system DNA specificity domain-containing protein [Pelosinus fermentans A11]
MSRFISYPVYKVSSVEWLGQIPEKWEVKPFKACIKFQEGPGIMATDFCESGIPLLRVSGMKGRWATLDGCNYLDVNKVSRQWAHFKLVRGDLLISASASMGTVCEVGEEAEGAIAYTGLIRLRGIENIMIKSFIRLLIGSSIFTTQIELFKTGSTIQHFGPTHLSQMKIVCPPIKEQHKIVDYIDCETTRIDALVEQKTRFIELLREKRQALITRAVTKGLDSQVKLKDCDVEWLGQVPEHWRVTLIKHLTKHIGSGKTPTGGAEVYQDDGVIFLRSQNVHDDGLRLEDVAYISEEIDCTMKGSRVQKGDVLLNITGASIGRSCLVPENMGSANANQHVCIIRGKDESVSAWLAECCLSGLIKEQIEFAQNGAGREGLNFEQIANMVIAVPPEAERKEISDWLTTQREHLNSLINKTEQSIQLLKERRTALITAAVTGKIDLREVVQ